LEPYKQLYYNILIYRTPLIKVIRKLLGKLHTALILDLILLFGVVS